MKRNWIIIVTLIFSIIGVASYWYFQKNSSQTSNTTDLFSFAVQADPHMDEQSDPNVYKQTLANIIKDKPAFLIDLGDTFMIDKLQSKSEENIKARYVLMKSYFDLLGNIPLYLVVGNHDGEAGWDKLNSSKYRLEYFPNNKYSYYSLEQNNSLFIILDPYRFTTTKPNADGWGWTLGKEQYDWLKNVLATSKAAHKFVFIHQLVGGDNQGRGGTELAKLYEWGGYNTDGSYGFDKNRPGWGKPIHQLLVDNKVEIVFKGHDHFYAKQDLDGIVYQTMPQPSHPGDKINTATEYGYTSGDIIGGSGHLLVTVVGDSVKVEFKQATATEKILDTYTLK